MTGCCDSGRQLNFSFIPVDHLPPDSQDFLDPHAGKEANGIHWEKLEVGIGNHRFPKAPRFINGENDRRRAGHLWATNLITRILSDLTVEFGPFKEHAQVSQMISRRKGLPTFAS